MHVFFASLYIEMTVENDIFDIYILRIDAFSYVVLKRKEQGFFCFVYFSPPAHERNEVGRNFRPSDFIGQLVSPFCFSHWSRCNLHCAKVGRTHVNNSPVSALL